MSLVYSAQLPIGWEAADFKLKSTRKKEYSLSDFKDKKGLVIIFTCNHCPYAQASWPIIIDLAEQLKKDIYFVAINSNDAFMYPEDSFEGMKDAVKDLGITLPYLWDETQEVAKIYDAQCTPDVYLFKNDKKKLKLYYHGRINDNWQDYKNVTEKNLEIAIESMLTGEDPPDSQPPSMGCSIKWAE